MAKKKTGDPGGGDPFGNPFALTSGDRQRLDDFFEDDGGGRGGGGAEGGRGMYEEVSGGVASYHHHNHNGGGGGEEDDEDYEYGNGRPPRRRRGRDEETIGGFLSFIPPPRLVPNMFSTSENSSFNTLWTGVLLSLLFFTGAYYGLSKQANERIRGQEAHLEGAVSPSHVAEVPAGTAPVGEKVPANPDGDSYPEYAPVEGSHEEEVGPALTFKQTEPPKFKLDTSQLNFDPFQMLQRPPTKIKDANDWPGAPFVVSPPKLPVVMNGNAEGAQHPADGDGGGVRLGYFQNPTVVDGTVVFSSEGDLYLTRLAEMELQNMPAMKLTTTLGNALHPKLNPLHPHLLVYSATYSGVREVYLMDLRSHTNGLLGTPLGAPGYPGGPALRLTYTPGGIVGVVGWDEDGTSVLYSAEGQDARALPDVRLFRLRLLWPQDEGIGVEGIGGREEVEDEDDEDAATRKSPKKTVMKGEDKEAAVRGESPGAEKKQGKKASGVKKGNNDASEPQEWEDDDDDDSLSIQKDTQEYVNTSPNKVTKMAVAKRGQNHDGKGGDRPKKVKKAAKKEEDEDRHRKLEREERQRRHLAKLAARQQSRRRLAKKSSVHSVVEEVPLAQAREGVYHTTASSAECVYFTRFKQSSSTKRYVGGGAESLWAYCPEEFDDLAVPLTGDYNGTSKGPLVHDFGGLVGERLLFMSDRAAVVRGDSNNATTGATEWAATSMDLWAAPLPLTSSGRFTGEPTRLTNVACQFNGIDLSEYAVDPSTGGAILRIGADLHYLSPQSILEKLSATGGAGRYPNLAPLPIAVFSDFSNMHERIVELSVQSHLSAVDAYPTPYGTVSALLTARGQTFVAPVLEDAEKASTGYGGGGRNMPERRYKVAPGNGGGGLVRILTAKHIPQPVQMSDPKDSGERLALLLATDPLSPTGEHAFFVIRTDAMTSPSFGFAALYEFVDSNVGGTGLPRPILGGHLATGGSTREGGLGSVYANTVSVSPCGRRFAFTDTDGRIVAVTIPASPLVVDFEGVDVVVLPQANEAGQPLVGNGETGLSWSPGGRYLAITHQARNQFQIISIADMGPPDDGKSIELGRIVQATTDRFNSFSPVWGHAGKDYVVELWAANLDPTKEPSEDPPESSGSATALIFLSDRDVKNTGASSPWGTRAPSPTYDGKTCVHVLPLQTKEDAVDHNSINKFVQAAYGGGGAMEVAMEGVQELGLLLEMMKQKQKAGVSDITLDQEQPQNATEPTADGSDNSTAIPGDGSDNSTTMPAIQPYVIDTPISFGEVGDTNFAFARSSYRMDRIPEGEYVMIVCQLADSPSLLMLEKGMIGYALTMFAMSDWPADDSEQIEDSPEHMVEDVGVSSDGKYILTVTALDGKIKVTPRTTMGAVGLFGDTGLEKNIAHTSGLHLSIWPNLEYQQMYKDAWRMLRDYFYDPEMHSVDWEAVFERYLPLVERCAKREELDDVLRQMLGELSALHSFVYGGEYSGPSEYVSVGCLGAVLQRSVEKRGYLVVDVPDRDPDFHMLDGSPLYSPLSDQVLKLSGQAGLKPGDIIVAVNHENVLDVPDMHMLLRNMAGESVRLDVLRMKSTSQLSEVRKAKRRLLLTEDEAEEEGVLPEPLLVVPMTSGESGRLAQAAWEWKARRRARSLAAAAGFTVGYIYMGSMSGASSIDSFARGFYPDYDKDALIIDVRNNSGGNIDSWLLDALQRTAWMYWEDRGSNITTGGMGWDMQFAFRGHLVVLINEHTSSDAEAFARGVSELGLGKLVGKRTWGGGIWLSSDNRLVDGGIATAPESGTYNDNWGWGLGVEQMGVEPDVEVDNNPRLAFKGEDAQLERAVSYLKNWLEQEPVALPKDPGHRRDMSKKEGVDDGCVA